MWPVHLIRLSTVLVWAARTNDQRLGGLNNEHLFLMILKPGSLRSGGQMVKCLVMVFSLVCRLLTKVCGSHHGERTT